MQTGNRVIPPGHRVYQLRLEGTSPLLMSSGEVDEDDPTYREFLQLGQKKNKSWEDQARLRELEWYCRIYYDEKLGPYIPSKNVKELLRSAATKWKSGEDVKRSLVIEAYRIPLIYDGPRTALELWQQGYKYVSMVANGGAGRGRVMRCRPCFDTWALECTIAIDPEDIDPDRLEAFVHRSQKYGLGDYRPEFGAFEATLTFVHEQREDAKANGHKPRDKKLEAAMATHHSRVTA